MNFVIPLLALCLSLLRMAQSQSNLLCDGGFERTIVALSCFNIFQNFMLKFSQPFNNYSCWYSSNRLNFEVKQFPVSGGITQVADFILSTGPSYTLCQNSTLVPYRTYELRFSFMLDGPHQQSTIFFALNGLFIYNVTSYSNITPTVGQFQFVTNQIMNSLCFDTQIVFKNTASIFDKNLFGPVLDNVSLIEVPTIYPALPDTTNPNTTITPNIAISPSISMNSNLSVTPNLTVNTNLTVNSSLTISPNSLTLQLPEQSVVVNLTTHWNPYTGILYMYSDWILDSRATLDYLQLFVVEINGEIQQNKQFKMDMEGYLYLETQPRVVYISYYINNFAIYISHEYVPLAAINFIFVLDGKAIKLNSLTEEEQKVVELVEPYILKITQNVKQAFVYLNMCYCSFLVLGIIEFWNLTLLYNFLNISSVPKFVEAFFSKMLNFFFTFNSLTTQINRLQGNSDPTASLADFGFLTSHEKVLSVRKGHVWFGFTGLSSNFLANNFDCMVLLSFFLIKCFILRVVIRLLRMKFTKLRSVRFQLILGQFASEILCFAPFIIISALSVFLYLGETNTFGKFNNFLHIFFVFFTITISCLALIKADKKTKRKPNERRQKFKNKMERAIKIFLNLLIPVSVVVNHSIGFFVLISPIILWKFVNFFCNLRAYSRLEKVLKMINNTCWLIYHLCFMAFFIFDYLEQTEFHLDKQIIKYIGFITILCVLTGGIFDILECILNILKFLKTRLLYFHQYCIRKSTTKQLKINCESKSREKAEQLSLFKDLKQSNPNPMPSKIVIKKDQNNRLNSILLNKQKSNNPGQQKPNNNQYKFIMIPVEKIEKTNAILINPKRGKKRAKKQKS